jgi:hypothetical protein
MNPMPSSSDTLHHYTRRMGGRDPNQMPWAKLVGQIAQAYGK